MTHDQIAALILGLCVLVPCLLAIACWLLWSQWRKEREARAKLNAMKARM